MSRTPMTPALHIARKHQSAPKAHWADKEIMKAAEEIDGGRWIPDPHDGMHNAEKLGIALGLGNRGAAVGMKPTLEDFQETRELNQLGRHPRVIEAIERMRKEVETITNPQEMMEKRWMLHEMNAANASKDKWDGQERWEGEENEEMRHGRLLTPYQFFTELVKVIGIGRVLLSGHIVPSEKNARTGRQGLYIQNPLWEGDPMIKPEYAAVKSRELREAAEHELVKAKQLRAKGEHSRADEAFDLAGEMVQQATMILMENSAEQQLKPTQFLRVGTLQAPLGTEWMVMAFDQYGVPVEAKYLGWRTALLTMIKTGTITEEEAHKAFPVGSGPAANWYLEQLYMLRNTGMRLV